jgi:hypothetical protein
MVEAVVLAVVVGFPLRAHAARRQLLFLPFTCT